MKNQIYSLFFFIFFLLYSVFSVYSQQVIWQKTIGGSTNDVIGVMKQTTDGGFAVAGYSYSDISGDKSEPNWDSTNASSDYWIVKLDSIGNIQWQNTIGSKGIDKINDIDYLDDEPF